MSGGKSNRLNWTDHNDRRASFGDWHIDGMEYVGSRHPFVVYFKGKAVIRMHGHNTGYQRFATLEAAKRWVERRLAPWRNKQWRRKLKEVLRTRTS